MEQHRVQPGTAVDLSQLDPHGIGGFEGGKTEAKEKFSQLRKELARLQELLYAEHKHKLLIALQAMDTGGKDSTIRHVFEGVNPQGVRVVNLKVPTTDELDHDYLWRVHKQVPGKGEIVIFNRSHYEDVLVVRVHDIVPEQVWGKRFHQINEFERILVEEGTTIMKFFLHINLDEQKKRLQERLEDPHKHWKFNAMDLQERKLWPEYMKAYEDALSKTSMKRAPWYIVPANRKWYRNFVVANTIVETLQGLSMHYPKPVENLDQIVIP